MCEKCKMLWKVGAPGFYHHEKKYHIYNCCMAKDEITVLMGEGFMGGIHHPYELFLFLTLFFKIQKIFFASVYQNYPGIVASIFHF